MGGLENYVLHSDIKFVYHIPRTDEPFAVAKYKKELGKPYSKKYFDLYKDEEYQFNFQTKYLLLAVNCFGRKVHIASIPYWQCSEYASEVSF